MGITRLQIIFCMAHSLAAYTLLRRGSREFGTKGRERAQGNAYAHIRGLPHEIVRAATV